MPILVFNDPDRPRVDSRPVHRAKNNTYLQYAERKKREPRRARTPLSIAVHACLYGVL